MEVVFHLHLLGVNQNIKYKSDHLWGYWLKPGGKDCFKKCQQGQRLIQYDDSRSYSPTFCDKHGRLAELQSVLAVQKTALLIHMCNKKR